jgi:hypothetical protein
MAALDFPSSPSNGQQYSGPGGVIWVYDLAGTKWVAATLAGGVFAPLVSPALTGNPTSVTPAAGDADTSIATTAFVAATVPGQNFADNAGFAVNQRTYVSGTALAAAAFGHDRWKGGAGGCTYTFAALAGPTNTITITAGTLQQVIEGTSLLAGNYMLSWTGTAQGRVGAGSYAASPVSVAGITAGANTTIEFNAGTLGRVKFEPGTVATPWTALPTQQDLARCQRFFQTGQVYFGGYSAGNVSAIGSWVFPVTMRAVPAIVVTTNADSNLTSPTYTNFGGSSVGFVGATPAGAVGWSINRVFTASADL